MSSYHICDHGCSVAKQVHNLGHRRRRQRVNIAKFVCHQAHVLPIRECIRYKHSWTFWDAPTHRYIYIHTFKTQTQKSQRAIDHACCSLHTQHIALTFLRSQIQSRFRYSARPCHHSTQKYAGHHRIQRQTMGILVVVAESPQTSMHHRCHKWLNSAQSTSSCCTKKQIPTSEMQQSHHSHKESW